MRRNGRDKFALFGNFWDWREISDALSREIKGIYQRSSNAKLSNRRRNDRCERRQKFVAARAKRSWFVRSHHKTNQKGRLCFGRKSASNRLFEFALACNYADDAPDRKRQRLRDCRRDSGWSGRHYIYLQSPIVRHPRNGRRHDWCRKCEFRRTGSDGYFGQCFHSKFPDFYGRRNRICVNAGRKIYLLSPPKLCLQKRCRRRFNRRGGADCRLQRRRKSLAHQR